MDVNFDDAATNSDIHIYRLQLGGSQGTPLTGDWAPDARVASPTNVLDTDVRSAILGSFNGVDPNGEWVLFVADMEAGDIHRLDSWSLEITGDTAPAGLAATEAAGRGELVDIKTPANHSSYLTVATSGTAPNDLNVNNLTN